MSPTSKKPLECCHSNRAEPPNSVLNAQHVPQMPIHPKKNSSQGKISHQVRIIGGQWKRTPLKVVSADGLRPTPDRVRETVFNWIHHLVHGRWESMRCLDLFAGSGALGFEAASRGAVHVLMSEIYTPAFQQLELTKENLKANTIQLQRNDALLLAQSLLRREERFNLVFLDPPFHQGFLQKIMPLCIELLAEDGLLYVEAEQSLPFGDVEQIWCQSWKALRQDQAGSVYFYLLQRSQE